MFIFPWTFFLKRLFTDSMDKYFNFFRVKRVPIMILFVSGDILKGWQIVLFIVTDTYHVAINAIALGVACINDS